ncbi:MAG: Uma2 family endonuclease [Chloroflexota bacterium]
MTSNIPTAFLEPMSTQTQANELIWRMSVETYHQMIEAGAFGEDEAIELIHGYLIKKMPKNRRHAQITQILFSLLAQLIGFNRGWFLSIQDPITLDDSEPEPDIAIIRGTPADYSNHPQAADIGIVIEISDSSLEYDRGLKKQMYAINRVAEYWIVNVDTEQIEVYTEPFSQENEAGYSNKSIYLAADQLSVALDDQHFAPITVGSIFV